MGDIIKVFATNFRYIRLSRGFTQKQLADRINFSCQSVSKWEKGIGVPDAVTLAKIASVLSVSIDAFFVDDSVYFLGIDGGGTKTAYTLVDENDNVVNEVKGDNCNPVDIGIELATNRLEEGILSVCKDIPFSKIYVFAGIAGGTASKFHPALMDFFGKFGFCAYEVNSDNCNIVSAGLGARNGVSLILGTGICAYRQKDGEQKRYSGWGYFFDNGGSSFNIGREGIAAHFEALDGIGEPTEISRIILEDHEDSNEFIGELYDGGKRGISRFSRVVYAAAERGDKIALSILKRNVKCIAKIIETAAADLTEDVIPVVIAGGLTCEPMTLELLKEEMKPLDKYDLKVLEVPPVRGAVLLAKELSILNKEKGDSK